MKLVSRYSSLHHIDTEAPQLPDLKTLIAPWTRDRIRRIDRYIELCVAGGLNCVGDRKLPDHTGVYLATRYGAVTTSAKVMEAIVAEGDMPRPLHFVNTLGNSACFYLTRLLGTTGNTLVISQEELSFEAALFHAWLDLHQGNVKAALVGGIDEVALPLQQQADRLGVKASGFFTEGTHWLLLEKNNESLTDLTTPVFEQPRYFADLTELAQYLENYPDSLLHAAFTLSAREQKILGAANISTFTPADTTTHGVYNGALLITLCDRLMAQGGTGLHLAKNAQDHYFVQAIRCYPD